MPQNVFSLDELNHLKNDICKMMDFYLKEAENILHCTNTFIGVEESVSSSEALCYLNLRYKEVMDNFLECNRDFTRLMQIIQEKSLTLPQVKQIPEGSDEEFLFRAKKQYSI